MPSSTRPRTGPFVVGTTWRGAISQWKWLIVGLLGGVRSGRKEALQEQGELGGLLDLGPVPALAEHVQLGTRDELGETQRGLERDDPVLPSMDDQGLVWEGAQALVRQGERVHRRLAGGGEHRR